MNRLILVALLALAGCATSPPMMWKHQSHANKARFDQDRTRCEYEAAQATGSYTPDTRGYRTLLVQDLAAATEIGQRQTQIGVLCMKARGYSLHPVDDTVIR